MVDKIYRYMYMNTQKGVYSIKKPVICKILISSSDDGLFRIMC